MAEHIDFYRRRKARRGFGARKAYLLEQYWRLENEITHHIIAGACARGDHTVESRYNERLTTAERLRDKTGEELHTITRPVE